MYTVTKRSINMIQRTIKPQQTNAQGEQFDILMSSKNKTLLRHRASRKVYCVERTSLHTFTLSESVFETNYKRYYRELGQYNSQIEAAMSIKSMYKNKAAA